MNRKTILIIVGVVLALCVCACLSIFAISGLGVLGGLGWTQPVADTGEKFMQSLKAGDYTAAYNLCDKSLQQKLGSPNGLKQIIEQGQAKPIKWSFNSRNIENDQGTLSGDVTMQGGEGTVTLELIKSGNDWKLVSFDLSEN